MAWAAPAHALTVQHVTLTPQHTQTRIVITIDNPASDFRAFTLSNPWRLAVDLPAFDWQAGAIHRPPGALVTGLRQGNLQPGTSRIIFDLSGPTAIRTATLAPGRLSITVAPTPETQAMAAKAKVFGTLNNTPANPPATTKTPADIVAQDVAGDAGKAKSQTPTVQAIVIPPDQDAPKHGPPAGKPLIVIDPGHGGIDPGTMGAGGIVEKNVTLAAAQILRDELVLTGRYRVLLTRDSDTYLFLPQRVAFARAHHADIFISLHADSSPLGPDAAGASIYTLSDTASDAETAKLAAKENRADQVAGMDLRNQDDDVANILVNLAMRDTMNHATFLANTVATTLHSHAIPTLERAHRAAGFAVLKDPDVPSILVEMGFLSNPRQAAALSDPDFQHHLARALVASLDAYFIKVRGP